MAKLRILVIHQESLIMGPEGVEEKPEEGVFWIKRAADDGLVAAIKFIEKENLK